MNVMLAAAGYPWIVVPVKRRDTYMAALEDASARQNVIPFAQFLGGFVRESPGGKIITKVPEARS
jgi:hypothetical protein